MRHTRSEIPDILIPIGYLAAFAVCAAGYGLGLSPDPTGGAACLVLVATLALQCSRRTNRSDWDMGLSRLLAGELPPSPKDMDHSG
jgi:hypothetical protein